MMKTTPIRLLALCLAMTTPCLARTPAIDLAGTWRFQLDPGDAGMDQQWFDRELSDRIQLPGSLTTQGFGDEIRLNTPWTGSVNDPTWANEPEYAAYRQPGQIKVPFWLQPQRYFKGAAWYQREVDIPTGWAGGRIILTLERPHWETRVWVNDQPIGSCESLCTPHEYDLSNLVSPGRHRITVRVDNRMIVDVGQNAHSVSDHTQGNWNGIVGALELTWQPSVWIDEVQVYPDVKQKKVQVRIALGNRSGEAGSGNLTLQAAGVASPRGALSPRTYPVQWDPQGGTLEVDYPLGPDVRLWDEFQPHLYQLDVALAVSGATDSPDTVESDASKSVRFGMRQLTVDGTQFVLNDRKIFFRGTLECCIFPLTGHPPTDVEAWRRIIRICQAHGLNHMRFHSWCPPKAAFVAADEMGFYYHVECAAWARIGEGGPIDRWLNEETERILRAYGNHPSFMLLAYGNEPGGPERGARFLRPWCRQWQERDSRRLFTSGAGWPLIAESDFHSTPAPRLQQWGAGLRSIINAHPPRSDFDFGDFVTQHPDKPTISHEIGQWCVYPNFAEMDKYTGPLKPKNFEIFRETLERNHMGDQAHDFLMASGKLQTLCYKADIEAALRTRGFGGFQLLDLHDFPGQGTALVGVLDPFWESKPYVTSAEYRRFAGPTVPLARLSRRVFRQSDTLTASIELAHFGPVPLKDAQPSWRLVDGQGHVVRQGQLPRREIPLGNGILLGEIQLPLNDLAVPARYTLVVGLNDTDGENDWDVWVYPDDVATDTSEKTLVTHELDETAQARLRDGGRVLLLPLPQTVKGGVAIGFSSIFWNTAWTGNQPPHTLGILCQPEHPVFQHFPTQYHSDWQWWELIHDSGAMVLDGLPAQMRPLVQPIDTWFKNRRLGLLLEAKVSGGSLLVCSMNLMDDLQDRLVARQFRYSLMQYMRSDQFAPQIEVTTEAIQSLFKEPSRLQEWNATIRADSQQDGYEAQRAIDGDPRTIWHSRWDPVPDPPPHELVLDLQASRTLRGLRYLPRSDLPNGRIAKYHIHVSDQARDWGDPVATGVWQNSSDWQEARFPQPRQGRYVRLSIESEVNLQPFASAAEIDLVVEE